MSPTYEYMCSECGYKEEVDHGINDTLLLQCDKCGKNFMDRLISGGAPPIIRNTKTPYKGT